MKLFAGQIFPEVSINDDEQQHIAKVLRMRAGEKISVTDGNGTIAHGSLEFYGKKVGLQVDNIEQNLPEFPRRLHIAIAPTKNIDRTEFFVEKATEMGIAEITFLQTENTERKNINIDRIRKQAIAASKQSLRVYFPILHDSVKLPDFLKQITPENTFVCHCNAALERSSLKEIESTKNITILVGPEGDFSEKEIQQLAGAGVRGISLGDQRLRTETAGVFVAAWNYFLM